MVAPGDTGVDETRPEDFDLDRLQAQHDDLVQPERLLSVLELDSKSRASEEVRQVYSEILRLVGRQALSHAAKPETSEGGKPEGSRRTKAKAPA